MNGYVHCGCRDCFELAIGEPGELCGECDDAGCGAEHDGGGECRRPDAYESAESESPIRRACAEHGFALLTTRGGEPRMLADLIDALAELSPDGARTLAATGALATVPAAALDDGSHAWWESESAAAVLALVTRAINDAAPAGFELDFGSHWDRVGLFPAGERERKAGA